MTATTTTRPTTSHACTCGCGLPVSRKALYRPGHDAKHVSLVVAGELTLDTLPSKALQIKALAALGRIDAKTHQIDPTEIAFEGIIKVGRWDYPARTFANGAQERNTKRDGSGEWVAV